MVKTNHTRRDFLRMTGLGMTSLAIHGSTAGSLEAACEVEENLVSDSQHKSNRPNFLWLIIEGASPDFGCYGDTYAYSPNIDKLASQGCLFTRCYTASPVCGPARSAIITGVYPSSIGSHNMNQRPTMHHYQVVPPPKVKCITEYLRARGYFCTNWSGVEDYQFIAPFTAWSAGSFHDYHDAPREKPFLHICNFEITHESGNDDIDNIPLGQTSHPSNAKIPPYRNPEKVDYSKLPLHDPTKVKLPPYHPDTLKVRKSWARSYDNLMLVDEYIGVMLKRLQEEGLADNTVVIVTSDHGRGFPRNKKCLYDGGIQIPLIVRWPGKIKPGSKCDDLISGVDIPATILSMAGIKIPDHVNGIAFLGEQKSHESRQYIVSGYDRAVPVDFEPDHTRCIRDKRYKYIRNFKPSLPYSSSPYERTNPVWQEMTRLDSEGKLEGPQKLYLQKTRPKEELYDTLNDPYEINNLADLPEHQNLLKKMREELDKWMEETGDLGNTPEEVLMKRFWPGGKQPVTADPVIKLTYGPEGSIVIEINCPTEGASIGYRYGDEGWWSLYVEPLVFENKVHAQIMLSMLNFKAARYGWRVSNIVYGESTVKKHFTE